MLASVSDWLTVIIYLNFFIQLSHGVFINVIAVHEPELKRAKPALNC